jgi:hypothetical protein
MPTCAGMLWNCFPFWSTWVHPSVFSGVRVTRSLILCLWFLDRCLSFCTFSFGYCSVMLCVLLVFKCLKRTHYLFNWNKHIEYNY